MDDKITEQIYRIVALNITFLALLLANLRMVIKTGALLASVKRLLKTCRELNDSTDEKLREMKSIDGAGEEWKR